jgi:hypothetical protein
MSEIQERPAGLPEGSRSKTWAGRRRIRDPRSFQPWVSVGPGSLACNIIGAASRRRRACRLWKRRLMSAGRCKRD